MEKEKFFENVIEILEIEDPSSINDSTKFRELDEWDSLNALSIISMVDEEFGITISKKEIKGAETLGELYNLIQERAK